MQTLITAGLASVVTASGVLFAEFAREGHERYLEQCRLAGAILQDDTPSPYLDPDRATVVTRAASTTMLHCIRE